MKKNYIVGDFLAFSGIITLCYSDFTLLNFADENKERLILKSPSKDDDDIIATAMGYLK
ncbi:MAG: hypothetical protein JXQ76_09350 [Campylobacterales bacterium]|nr:hypothetical protein [Campylobacterales bacterium]